MTVLGFLWVLYDIVTYPFKQIWRYFNPPPPVVTEIKKNNVVKFVANLPPRYKRRVPNETQGKIHYRPLFMSDWFSSLSDSKNDREFKDAREKARKKDERIKAREEFMKKLELKKTEKKESDSSDDLSPRT